MSSVGAEELLEVGFERFSGEFADGQAANNKLDLSYQRLKEHPKLFRRVITGLCELAEPYEPEFTVGNPDEATGLAGAVALEMDLYCLHLAKNPDTGTVSFASSIDRFSLEHLDQGVGVEDVFNRRTTTQRVLALPGLSDKLLAVVGIFDRGIASEKHEVVRPVHSLVTTPIPAQLTAKNDLWRYE